jgi:hypothetical protein
MTPIKTAGFEPFLVTRICAEAIVRHIVLGHSNLES